MQKNRKFAKEWLVRSAAGTAALCVGGYELLTSGPKLAQSIPAGLRAAREQFNADLPLDLAFDVSVLELTVATADAIVAGIKKAAQPLEHGAKVLTNGAKHLAWLDTHIELDK